MWLFLESENDGKIEFRRAVKEWDNLDLDSHHVRDRMHSRKALEPLFRATTPIDSPSSSRRLLASHGPTWPNLPYTISFLDSGAPAATLTDHCYCRPIISSSAEAWDVRVSSSR